jgi:predicted permease
MTGFEYGMLGVSLFGSTYGLDKVGYIAIVDLGHEIFIWFVFLALLLMKRDQVQHPAQLMQSFFKSPVIIAILAGILFNILGARDFLFESAVTGGIMAALQFMSSMTIPLILIIVGYGIRFDRNGIRDGLLVAGIRLAILVPLALILNVVVIRGLLDLEAPFADALFTLLILPPPFIIPLYMRSDLVDEKQYITNVLTLYTMISVVLYAGYIIVTG